MTARTHYQSNIIDNIITRAGLETSRFESRIQQRKTTSLI